MPPVRSCKVAVIGAGISGLVAARELLREHHDITIFEKSDRIGGTWAYDPRIDSDLVGLDPNREKVHSSLYASLRINNPRALMGLSDYPLAGRVFRDGREYPGHQEVLQFIEAFARDYGLMGFVRFGAAVISVRRSTTNVESRCRWLLEWRRGPEEDVEVEEFEAIVVCNGHNSQPRVPEIPGHSLRTINMYILVFKGTKTYYCCGIMTYIFKVWEEQSIDICMHGSRTVSESLPETTLINPNLLDKSFHIYIQYI